MAELDVQEPVKPKARQIRVVLFIFKFLPTALLFELGYGVCVRIAVQSCVALCQLFSIYTLLTELLNLLVGDFSNVAREEIGYEEIQCELCLIPNSSAED